MGKHKGVFLQAVSELKLFLFGSALVLTVVSVVPALAQFGGDMGGGGFVQQQPQQQMQPVAPMQQQQQQPVQQQPVQQQPMEQLVPQQQNLQQQPQQPLGGQQPQMQQFGGKQQQGEQGQLPPGLSNKGKIPSGLKEQNKTPQGWEQGGKKGFEGGEFKLPSTGLKEMPKDKFPSTGKINAPSEMSGDFEDFKFDTQKPDKKGKLQFEDFGNLDFDTDLGQSKKKPGKINFPSSLDQFEEEEAPKFKQPKFQQLEEIQEEVEFSADDYVQNLVKGLPLIEKAQSKFESSLEKATSDKAALSLAKKAASKFNSFCKYAKLPQLPPEIEIGVEGFECKAFVKEASAAILSAIKAKDVDTAIENVGITYEGLITNFESLQSSIEAAVEAANSGEEEFVEEEEEEEFDF